MEQSDDITLKITKLLATAESLLDLSQRHNEGFLIISPISELEPGRDLENAPSYEYTTLQKGQIRVLEILYGIEDQTISCRMKILSEPGFTLLRVEESIETLLLSTSDDKRSNLMKTTAIESVRRKITELDINYDALSYTWEGQVPERPILVDGRVMLITPNLESALKTIRKDILREYTDQDTSAMFRRIWIDSICINQADLIEKQIQVVAMMRDIYALASGLDIWLGPGEDVGNTAGFAALSKTLEMLRTNPHLIAEKNCNPKSNDVQPDFGISKRNWAHGRHTIAQLLSSNWFLRAWVVQEYSVGLPRQRRVFRYGSLRMHEDEVTQLVKFFKETFPGPLSKAVINERMEILSGDVRLLDLAVTRIAHHAKRIQAEGANDLLFWVRMHRKTFSTDPRDKIYAFLGIIRGLETAHECGFEGLLIDYKATIQDVFSSFVKHVVVSTRSLDILCMNGERRHFVSRTWTPDWTAPGSFFIPNLDDSGAFKASGDSQCFISFPKGLDVLRVREFVWDKVFLQNKFPSAPDLLTICTGLSVIYTRSATQPIPAMYGYRSKNDMKKALWKTLLYAQDDNRLSNLDLKYLDNLSYQAVPTPDSRVKDDPVSWMSMELIDKMEAIPQNEFFRVITTANGFVGKTFDPRAQEGDIIVILLGCSHPVILRPVSNHFEYVIDVYIDGIMYGEAMKALAEGHVELRDFDIY